MCNTYYAGSAAWDTAAQQWANNCSLADCPAHAKKLAFVNSAPQGCVCTTGFTPSPKWDAAAQTYAGCSQVALCPANADASTDAATGGPKCTCLQGFSGRPAWDSALAAFTHTCTQVNCPSGSSRDPATTLCACDIGYNGTLTWDTTDQTYTGMCQLAPCTGSGANCDLTKKTAAATVPCLDGYSMQTVWDFTQQAWLNKCTQVACPDNSVRTGEATCECAWGFSGALSWVSTSQTYGGSCKRVECSAPSSNTGDGHCACPEATLDGTCKFGKTDLWACECGSLARCPDHSSGSTACKCDVGYKGILGTIPKLTIVDEPQTTSVQLTTQRTGECTAVECPANSLANSFPACACASGYAGSISWADASSSWVSTCALAECPANATGAPVCKCNKGYLGSLNWNAQKQVWEGVCSLAVCPSGASSVVVASVPSCPCDVGFRGVEAWSATEGWTHTCTETSCPALSSKVTADATNQKQSLRKGDCRCVSGYKGKYVWQGSEYIGSCELAACPANAVCSTTVTCNRGYKGSALFTWDFANEAWVGECVAQQCPANTRADSFPSCGCGLGYQGSIGWDKTVEGFTGSCSAVACPANSDNNFPSCKCNKGFVRSDSAANTVIGWDFDAQVWRQSCMEVLCPAFSSKVSTGDCSCKIGYRGTPTFDMTSATYVVVNSGDFSACKLVDCPANSVRVGSSCQCMDGWKGDLSWDPAAFSWGTCSAVDCPLHSHGHPHCACNEGYLGTVTWINDAFVGTCLEQTSTPTWTGVSTDAVAGAKCVRLQGPRDTLGSPDGASSDWMLVFGGKADTDVSILRCEIKLDQEFTKVKGSFVVAPTTAKGIDNNAAIGQWNASTATPSTSFVAFGTPYTIVDPGREQGISAVSYNARHTITIPESTVTQSNTLRFEISQPAGVQMSITSINLSTYNLPQEIVKCTRTISTATANTTTTTATHL